MTTVSLADDLLTGCKAIAEFLGWPERRVYHAHAQGFLPIAAVGRTLIARKSELDKALSASTSSTLEVA